jgi:hypothetical protein
LRRKKIGLVAFGLFSCFCTHYVLFVRFCRKWRFGLLVDRRSTVGDTLVLRLLFERFLKSPAHSLDCPYAGHWQTFFSGELMASEINKQQP